MPILYMICRFIVHRAHVRNRMKRCFHLHKSHTYHIHICDTFPPFQHIIIFRETFVQAREQVSTFCGF